MYNQQQQVPYQPYQNQQQPPNMMMMGGGPQQQQYQQQQPMMMMGGQPGVGGYSPHQSMAPQQQLLWPNGIYITDRKVDDPNACSCPPCWCCSRPVWFTSDNFQQYGNEARQTFHCTSWKITDADVLGQRMSFEGKQCCGVESMCEPEIHISENGREIGKAVMLLPCSCTFGEVDMCVVKDASGNPRYVRKENMCCPQYRYWSGDWCGFQQYRWPIHPANTTAKTGYNSAFGHIMFRYHACFLCHPIQVGIDGNDMRNMNVPPDDQKLLIGMALCRWWRAEQDQKQDGDSNPAF